MRAPRLMQPVVQKDQTIFNFTNFTQNVGDYLPCVDSILKQKCINNAFSFLGHVLRTKRIARLNEKINTHFKCFMLHALYYSNLQRGNLQCANVIKI